MMMMYVSEWGSEWSEMKWSEVKWVSERVSEGGREWGSEWVIECVCVCEWVSGWVGEWVSEWVRVSEWGLYVMHCVLCFVGCVLLCYVLWERRGVSLGRKVVVDVHGLPLTSPPPANVVSARPKPNHLVRTKASTSVLKQVGTYLHMYCFGSATGESISGQYLQTDNETGPKMNLFFPSIANARSSTYRTEPFGKDEGIDLSVEAGGNIFAYVLHAAQPAARASLVSTCRSIMKQDRRWTCSFPPSQMPGAQPTGKKVPSSLPNQKASSIVTYMTYRPHGDPGFQARWKQSSQKQTLEAVSWKQSSKLPQLEPQPRGKSLPWSSCSRRCWPRRRTDLPPAKVGEPSYPLRIL